MSDVITSATGLIDGFESFDARLKRERKLRVEAGKGVLTFGVSFLDEALGGIYKNDLIVLGAKSGLGKTQLSTLIALSNARAGKRVHYIALEAEEYEIERRVKYQAIADAFFGNPDRSPHHRLNYLDWHYGNLDSWIGQYEEIAEAQLKFPSMYVYYRKNDFTERDFERIYLSIKAETDLIIIDHLHYFDFTDENENRAVKAIVKKIRDLTLNVGKPVVLVSHIRKTDKRLKQVLPDLEDFHGSSDIGKIATKAIAIAPDLNAPMLKTARGTFIGVIKCRVDGSRTRAVALINYNLNRQKYDEDYVLGHLNSDQSAFTASSLAELPEWSVSCKNRGAKKPTEGWV